MVEDQKLILDMCNLKSILDNQTEMSGGQIGNLQARLEVILHAEFSIANLQLS